MGLLVPDYIDKSTGYRYYGPEKVAEMEQIMELKNIGFTLDEIKRYCETENDSERKKIIEEKHWLLTKLSEDTTRNLKKLEEIKQNLLKGETKMPVNIDMDASFENDERVIGCWDSVATVNNKEDFKPENTYKAETDFKEIYFLPEGKQYWGFGWTKNYLKITFGDGMICPYEITEINGGQYMFITYNNANIWVLKQRDNKRYSKKEIALNDYIGLPFDNDEKIIGKWNAVDVVKNIEDFDPAKIKYKEDLHYVSAEFLPDGILRNYYKDYINDNMKWTKGTTLLNWGDGTSLAPAYEIREFNGKEYLFIEWKSGDYIYGKRKPCYYVFVRE